MSSETESRPPGPRAESVQPFIRRRRSVRSYTGEQLDEALVRRLLDAAAWAPSATPDTPRSFVVIQSREMLERHALRAQREMLANPPWGVGVLDAWRAMLAGPPQDLFLGAGTLILVCGQAVHPFAAADCWLAAGNLMLEAAAADLGSCCIGLAIPWLNRAEVKRELWIPDDLIVVAPIVVGVPREAPDPAIPREVDILRWAS